MYHLKLISLLSSVLISYTTFSQKLPAEIEYEQFVRETQKMKTESENIKLVWWIPTIFWEIVAEKNPNVPREAIDNITEVLEEYTILCVVDAKIAGSQFVHISEEKIRKSIQIEVNGGFFKPVEQEELSEYAVMTKNIMEPICSSMLGNLGSGMKFYFFHTNNRAGQNYLNPVDYRVFTVHLTGDKFEWQLPLVCMLEEKICPVDKKELPGNFSYCPYHGVPLPEPVDELSDPPTE